ncbi:MAG: hypothetical protein V1729_00495 [Candidatus Woesearchaeota archaeon]
MTNIFKPEDVIKYAETRLFGSNVGPDDVEKIELHNGPLPSQLERSIIDRAGGFVRVQQKNGREPIYFSEKTLFIPQYSIFERGTRYELMIRAYLEATGRNIETEVIEHGEDKRVTYMQYENNAYDFVVGLFVPEKKYEDRRIFSSTDMKDTNKIVIGPLEAVAKQARVIERGKSEYLDAQLVDIGGEIVLNIGYVYGGQGGLIISKMMREYAALAERQGGRRSLEVFTFGRVGGLKQGMLRHDMIIPTGIIDWVRLREGKRLVHPFHNRLAPDSHESTILNVPSVVDQTVEQLELACANGCDGVEMEARDLASAIEQAQRRHYDNLTINFGFAGNISDLPLEGDTLADELDSDKGEQAAVSRIVETVRRRQ